MSSSVLPSNATDWEKAVADALAPVQERIDQISAIKGTKYSQPPADLLPFLIYEYGLGELTPYVPNLYDLIDQGLRWQRIRGTHKSVHDALAWLNYTAIIEIEPVRRRRWHLFQLGLDRHRDKFEDLDRIEGVTTLSVPARSHFWRGFSYYDIRALENDYTKWDDTLWDDLSGVRVRERGAKWSFGRPHDVDYTLTQADMQALGVWSVPIPTGQTWEAPPTTWEEPELTWDRVSPAARRSGIINLLNDRQGYVAYKDDQSNIIGYRRFKCCGGIKGSTTGTIIRGATTYSRVSEAAEFLYIEALTDFDQVADKTAKSVTVLFDAVPTDPSKPGLSWVEPGQLGGTQIAVAVDQPVEIEFARTIRESTRFFITI